MEQLLARSGRGAKLGLERIREGLAALGEPQRELCCVHVAGTNGKGSTSAMLEAIARAAGLSTGLSTSPHVTRLNERIRASLGFAEPLFQCCKPTCHLRISNDKPLRTEQAINEKHRKKLGHTTLERKRRDTAE